MTMLAGAVALVLQTSAAHAQNAAAGAGVFAQCEVCHSIDGSNGVGPSLKGVVGRTAGTAPGFDFSPAFKAVAKPWDAKSLDAFIADPQKAVPGNVMSFVGIPEAKDRADLVAYLATLK
ncbi:MAG TPA: c-type cytochrome [Caulobacteraceae bacterium]|jgi:cytochrome c|nr:c-type cytochrome [Caulobacteraceae bacterium]